VLSIQKKDKIMNNSFEINVLVNGNRCKQYHFNNKIFIEAKHGSEYELEIKNNTWGRLLCLGSVDGLNVLNGTPATDSDPGYVIQAYSPLRIKGFRFSNDEVAAFKFTNKGDSYAHSVGGNETAQNCGVIGFKLYDEVLKLPQVININNLMMGNLDSDNIKVGGDCYGAPTNDFDDYYHTSNIGCSSLRSGQNQSYNTSVNTKGISAQFLQSLNPPPALSFDMGSTWGKKIESKVVETDFEKGNLTFSLDIYYASRQSLIDMGVPINVGHQVNFPQSFPNKYAKPPTGWKG
jgi:hypothetical protein